MKFLLPVDSRVNNTQGFITLDTENQQLTDYPLEEQLRFNRSGFRGGCIVNDVIYVCNSFSVKAYRVVQTNTDWDFTLLWQLQLPEWLMGRAANADLHTVFFDQNKQVLLVANSYMDALDMISLDGRFLQRQFLWEMSDSVLQLVTKRDAAAPDLCHFNHIAQAFGETFLTLGNLNATGRGAVLHKESGKLVIDDLERPHDGVFWNNEFWITETSAYRLRVYTDIYAVEDFEGADFRIIDLSHIVSDNNKFWCRGLYITADKVYLGCSQFQDRKKDNPLMPPSHILEIEKSSGKVINRFDIPGSSLLSRPVLFSLLRY
ncbi:hypothetical protein [Rheinheimera pleomorphica]|uniref:hypothetical protein n=1 Tax=Rheinheimera pleomorphica TaxID=2703963 RepID=UPI0014213863|nr:hypothetical protein [Rheinheimera pleomorphica]